MFNFTEVMYSSELRRNLLSALQLDKMDLSLYGNNGVVDIWREDEQFIQCSLKRRLYQLFPQTTKTDKSTATLEAFSAKKESKMQLGHHRIRHISPVILIILVRKTEFVFNRFKRYRFSL